MWAGQGQVWHGDSSGIEQWVDGAGQGKTLSQRQRSQGGTGLVLRQGPSKGRVTTGGCPGAETVQGAGFEGAEMGFGQSAGAGC